MDKPTLHIPYFNILCYFKILFVAYASHIYLSTKLIRHCYEAECGEDNVVNFNTITKSLDNMSADGHGSYLVIRVT